MLSRIFTNPLALFVHSFLKRMKVKISFQSLQDYLAKHPNPNSLLSVSDCLSHFKIKNIAVKDPSLKIEDLPIPFIVHLDKPTPNMAMVVHMNQNKIKLIQDNNKRLELSPVEFNENWNGVILLTDTETYIGDPNYWRNTIKSVVEESLLYAAFLMPLYVCIANFSKNLELNPESYLNKFIVGSYALSFMGILICIALLRYEISNANKFLDKFCGGIKNGNCRSILNSDASKVWGLISWSEMGFIYFLGAFLSFSFSTSLLDVYYIHLYIFLLATPYPFYSIFYQWRIAKQWCIFCLGVQLILISQALFSIHNHINFEIIISQYNVLVNIVGFYLSIGIVWMLIKPLLIAKKENSHLKLNYDTLKYNVDTFNALLSKQTHLQSPSPNDIGIKIGAKNAKIELIKVCNPFCDPCSKAHTEIEDLVATNPNISTRIIFTTSPTKSHRAFDITSHLVSMYKRKDPNFIHALNDWYTGNKNYDWFASKYPIDEKDKNQLEEIKRMREWCDEIGITATPTIFVNNKKIPSIYSVSDLKYILSE